MFQSDTTSKSRQLYGHTPLRDVPFQYANMRRSQYRMHYLQTLVDHCPRGGTALEAGIGTGFDSNWLAQRGVIATGIDTVPEICEMANQAAAVLESSARFHVGDLFQLSPQGAVRYSLIHSQGVIEHFSALKMREALARETCLADYTIFSIPSIHYPYKPEYGNEILWNLSELEHHLREFDIECLTYYGDEAHGQKEHILCVLRGQAMNDQMRAIITEADAPYEPGITALVLARNEEAKLPDCLKSLWFAKEIIVGVMPSTDATRQIAEDAGATVVDLDYTPVFDHYRTVIAQRARTEYCVVADADERFPQALGEDLVRIVADPAADFAGMLLPFRHCLGGRELKFLYPGYTAPRLLRTGKFYFNLPLHGGVSLDGPSVHYPATDPQKAIEHLSNDSLSSYCAKQNAYTSTEALSAFREGKEFSSTEMLLHWLSDFRAYYDNTPATDDGPWKLFYAFCSANYRMMQHAKLFEHRANAGILKPEEWAVPGSVAEMLSLFVNAFNQRPAPQAAAIALADDVNAAELVCSAPLEDASGYGEDARGALFAMHSAGVRVRARSLPWSQDRSLFTPDQLAQYEAMCSIPARPGFTHLIQDLGNWPFYPGAGHTIARYMFETDRLPHGIAQKLNQLDRVIVPSEFNRRTFQDAGVHPDKIVVIPGCFDPAPYLAPPEPSELCDEIKATGRYTLLAVQEWSLRKGHDVLIPAFLSAFEGRTDVQLILKVWGASVPYTAEQIREQAARIAFEQCQVDLNTDSRIRIVTDTLSRGELLSLCKSADAFVSATRGEGWGRPLMEGMACARLTIATGGTGNTAFMNSDNSLLVDYDWIPVPSAIYAEIPTYQGHRCCEPRRDDLIDKMRFAVDNRSAEEAIALRGQQDVCGQFNLQVVGKMYADLLGQADLRAARPASTYAPPQTGQLEPDSTAQTVPDPPPAPKLVIHDRRASRRGKKQPAPQPIVVTPAEDVSQPLVVSDTRDFLAPGSPLPTAKALRPLRVRHVGAFFSWHSLALCNREIARRLAADPDLEVTLSPTEPAEFGPEVDPGLRVLQDRTYRLLPGEPDFEIRHHYPPRFGKPASPGTKLILIAPWEYFRLPKAWVQPILDNVTEVWCYSEAVRKCYLDSGIPAAMLQVIPLGVDTKVFHPNAAPYVLTDEPGAHSLAGFEKPPFVILFVGATLDRKGIDTIKLAYLNSFSVYDSVLLTIKDTGTNTVYRGATQGDHWRALAADPTKPAIAYIDRDLPPAEQAGLFVSANLLAQPYRNEGYCLPALEAMAAGVPPAVPWDAGGPTDDFCNSKVAILVPAALKPSGTSRIGEWDCCGETSTIETNPRDLGRALRWAYEHQEEVAALGRAAAIHARENYTWDHTVARMKERLLELQRRDAEQRIVIREDPGTAQIVSDVDPGAVNTSAGPVVQIPNTEYPTPRPESPGTGRLVLLDGHPAVLRTPPTIALTIIMRDEEANLPAAIGSAKPFYTAIYITDTGSKDNSVEVARDLGAIVTERPWDYSFSNARNHSLDQTQGEDYRAWMDCDDVLPSHCGEGIQRLVRMADDRLMGYLLQVHIPPGPGQDGLSIVDHVKLWKNVPGRQPRWEGRIHEQILESLYRCGGSVERTDLYVVHAMYDTSVPGQKKKHDRDRYLLQLEEEERPLHPYVKWCWGMSLHHWGEHAEAAVKLEECIALSQPQESTLRKAYALLCASYLALGNLDGARHNIEAGLRLFPRDPELLFRGGNFLHHVSQHAEAEQYYLRLFSNAETSHIDSRDHTISTYKGRFNYGLLLRDMNRFTEAETQWRMALSHNQNFVPAWQGLGELYIQMRRFDDCDQIIHQLSSQNIGAAEAVRQSLVAARGR